MTRHRPHDPHATTSTPIARPPADTPPRTDAPPADTGDAPPADSSDAPPRTDAPSAAEAPDTNVLLLDPSLVYDAMEALESLRHGVTEVVALNAAAGHLAGRGAPLDTPAGRRAARQLAYLALMAARRAEELDEEVEQLIRPLLDRFDAASYR